MPVFDTTSYKQVIDELRSALEPMVPYKIDPLEFCRAAHEVKDEHIQKALAILTNGLLLVPETK